MKLAMNWNASVLFEGAKWRRAGYKYNCKLTVILHSEMDVWKSSGNVIWPDGPFTSCKWIQQKNTPSAALVWLRVLTAAPCGMIKPHKKEPLSPTSYKTEGFLQLCVMCFNCMQTLTVKTTAKCMFNSARHVNMKVGFSHQNAYLVKACRDSNCLRCWESSFFSRDRRIQALARPTSVLISDILWICLRQTEKKNNAVVLRWRKSYLL